MALCEAAAWYRSQGITLCEQMEKLYDTYGYYKEDLTTVTLKGMEGAAKIREILEGIRKNPPVSVGSYSVKEFRDYEAGVTKKFGAEPGEYPAGLPKSNVLYFDLEDGAWCCIRPSGTEPKVKFYMGVRGEHEADSAQQLAALKRSVEALAKE